MGGTGSGGMSWFGPVADCAVVGLQTVVLLLLAAIACLGVAMVWHMYSPSVTATRQLDARWTMDTAVNAGLLVAAGLTAVFALWQLSHAQRTQRATFLKDVYAQVWGEGEVREAFHKIERGEFRFRPAFGGDRKEEAAIDRLLAVADFVCYLHRNGMLSNAELGIFRYKLQTLGRNPGIRQYLAWLGNWYGERKVGSKPYPWFFRWSQDRPDPAIGEARDVPKWRHDSIPVNLARVLPLVECYSTPAAEKATEEEVADTGSSLRRRLRTTETDCIGHPGAAFYGEALGRSAYTAARLELGLTKALDSARPLVEWPYGTEALRRGLAAVGWERVLPLLGKTLERDDVLVEAVWTVGLLDLAGCHDGWAQTSSELRRTIRDRDAHVERRTVIGEAERQLCCAASAVLGGELALPDWARFGRRRRLLWRNALAMVLRHEGDVGAGPQWLAAFRDLLQHVASGHGWPVDAGANHRFLEAHQCAKALRTDMAPKPVEVDHEGERVTIEVGFLGDPLEVLNIGNEFSSCLRLGGEDTALLLGLATNANIRVVAAKDSSGQIMARRTLGLVTGAVDGLRTAHAYPPSEGDLTKAILDFAKEFAAATGLQRVNAGEPVDLCAPAYSDWCKWEDA